MDKSIKIPELVHKELKIFTAKNNENMISVAGLAIMHYLSEKGHTFEKKQQKNKT